MKRPVAEHLERVNFCIFDDLQLIWIRPTATIFFRCSLFIYSSNIEYRTLSKEDIEVLISLRQEDDGLLKDHFSMHNQLLAGSHSIARIS